MKPKLLLPLFLLGIIGGFFTVLLLPLLFVIWLHRWQIANRPLASCADYMASSEFPSPIEPPEPQFDTQMSNDAWANSVILELAAKMGIDTK